MMSRKYYIIYTSSIFHYHYNLTTSCTKFRRFHLVSREIFNPLRLRNRGISLLRSVGCLLFINNRLLCCCSDELFDVDLCLMLDNFITNKWFCYIQEVEIFYFIRYLFYKSQFCTVQYSAVYFPVDFRINR